MAGRNPTQPFLSNFKPVATIGRRYLTTQRFHSVQLAFGRAYTQIVVGGKSSSFGGDPLLALDAMTFIVGLNVNAANYTPR